MGQFLLTMMTMMMCGLVVSGHINNLYNTTFWALQQKGGMSATEAEKELKVNQVYISCPHFRKEENTRHPPFPFIFFDWVREVGVKRIYLAF